MIRRLLSLLIGPLDETRQEARTLIVVHGPERAWLRARDRRRMADGLEAEDDSRYWRDVMREIERRTGFRPDKDTKTNG